jgi:hypothetical protein
MKKSNFLKVIFGSLLMIAMIGMFSCTKPKPECERNRTGTLTIYNDFPGVISVDVFDYTHNDFLGERTLGLGMSTTYTVHAGDCEIWEADAYSDWGFWYSYVDQCDNAVFSIYAAGKGPSQRMSNTPLDIAQKSKGERK